MSERPRKTSDGPWCWASKSALNRLEAATDGRTDRAILLAVYFTLCRIASNKASKAEGEGPFEVSKGELATRAGVSYRKCADSLKVLESIGLIRIKGNLIEGTQEQGPNTYTLLALGTPCLTSGTPCLGLGTENLRLGMDAKQASVPRLEKNNTEEQIEEHQRRLPQGAALVLSLESEDRAPKPPRKRDPLFDVLAEVTGHNPSALTKSEAGRIATALKDIKGACPDLTADEIRRRAANYRSHNGDAQLTPTALAAQWSKCDRGASSTTSTPARFRP